MFKKRMTFIAAHGKSKAHRSLTRKVAMTTEKVMRARLLASKLNPDHMKKEAMDRVLFS